MDRKKYEPIKNIHFENTNILERNCSFWEWERSIKYDACIILNRAKQCNSGMFSTVWHSGGALGMYVGGVCFESRLEHRALFSEVFLGFHLSL